ncbi:glycosyl hydrolase family 81 protein [Striga hermonthica]|uniref:Glycosyl hydrolase family 81 protein n=1 Tax=Striga hermonthica TaxID=68872 RepID=A0A9N7NHL1_STRHE|nr:glycosyl hydrolase family 81 protein [Striga hermonthica]
MVGRWRCAWPFGFDLDSNDTQTYERPPPFFHNFVLENGNQPEYFHSYLVQSSRSQLTQCYPSLSPFTTVVFFYLIFAADIAISTINNANLNAKPVISKYNDLNVTLDFPSNNLKIYLIRGSPFVTCKIRRKVSLSISTNHTIRVPNTDLTKYTIKLNNSKTWLLYASPPAKLTLDKNSISSSTDSSYPVSGKALFNEPFGIDYRWKKQGSGDLQILAHALYRRLVLDNLKYNSVDGELFLIICDYWAMKTEPVPVAWDSIEGINKQYDITSNNRKIILHHIK